MSEIDELRRLEWTCMDEAERCGTPDGSAAFLSLAGNYRAARLAVPMFAGQGSAQQSVRHYSAHTTPSRIGRLANKVLLVLVSALGIEPRTP